MIVFFSPPPRSEKKDGYFARVLEIDKLFKNQNRIYIEVTGRFDHFHLNPLGEKQWHLKIHREYANTSEFWNLLNRTASLIYFHSIYNFAEVVRSSSFIPPEKTAIDVHGVVPEEISNIGNHTLAIQFSEIEKIALSTIQTRIVVSNQMQIHLLKKYPNIKNGTFILLPTLKDRTWDLDENKIRIKTKQKTSATPTVAYIGGTQVWQNVDDMVKLIKDNRHIDFKIFSADFKKFEDLIKGAPNVSQCCFLSESELYRALESVHYSLILRDEHLLNRVSCPTKMIDTLASLTIPILKSPNIGDFATLNLSFISVDNFSKISSINPTRYGEMVLQNLQVLDQIDDSYQQGQLRLVGLYQSSSSSFEPRELDDQVKKIAQSVLATQFKLGGKGFWDLPHRAKLSLLLAKLKLRWLGNWK